MRECCRQSQAEMVSNSKKQNTRMSTPNLGTTLQHCGGSERGRGRIVAPFSLFLVEAFLVSPSISPFLPTSLPLTLACMRRERQLEARQESPRWHSFHSPPSAGSKHFANVFREMGEGVRRVPAPALIPLPGHFRAYVHLSDPICQSHGLNTLLK